MKTLIKNLIKKVDKRGYLSEIIKPEDVNNKLFGQLIITTLEPGMVKGNHYHKRKTEWYCLIKGEANLLLSDLKKTNWENVRLSEKEMKLIKIPPLLFHGIKNIGKETMYLLVYSNERFDEQNPDTYYNNELNLV